MAIRTVNGNTFTENGWPLVDEAGCTWTTIPGTDPPVNIELQSGIPAKALGAWAADWNAYIEKLRDADSASWTESNSVLGEPGQNDGSNHLGGTAEDLNWNSHPMGPHAPDDPAAGFSQAQCDEMQRMKAYYTFTAKDGTVIQIVWWSNDWDSPHDSMHSQMGYNTYQYRDEVQEWIDTHIDANGFSGYRRGDPAPQPAPMPAPDSRQAAMQALYDAVPEIATVADAAPLIDDVMQGLALSQCTNAKRIAMWLAQIGEESGGFVYTQEIQPPPGAQYPPFIGRTWIQITWQSNYAAFGRWCVQQGLLDDPNYFLTNPEALADLKWAGIGPAWYWTVARPTINSLCDQGDVVGVTQLINGGQNGIADRRSRYQQAIALGDELLALIPSAAPTPTPTTGGLMAALTDDEQQELLTKTREIWDQLRGPGANGWPQLGGRTLVDAVATLLKPAKKTTP